MKTASNLQHEQRIERLRAILREENADAMLISNPYNRRYLSGYTAIDHDISESSGFLLIPLQGMPLLFTDFRFTEQAEKEATGFRIEMYTKGLVDLLRTLLPRLGLKRLAFEADYTLHTSAMELAELGQETGVTMLPLQGLIEEMRCIKDEEEIEKIRKSVLLNDKVFQKIYGELALYETEIDLALGLASTMRKFGAEGESFPSIVASGARASLPHAVPGARKIAQDQCLLIDMGLLLDGYCSDMTRTFCPDPDSADATYLERHRIVRKAQLAAMAAVQAGKTGREIDAAARQIISDAGYGKQFGHALGHGVGLAVHESPRVSMRNNTPLQAGMIITIEPGIYVPGWGGIRLENMVVVREGGCEVLTQDSTALDI